jgi:spermidine synthase
MKEKKNSWMWFHDYFSKTEIHLHGFTDIYASIKTKYQSIDIVEFPCFGKTLIIDGDVQSSIKDEYIYHEALVHPAMLLSDNVRNVFLAGGGEGSTLREILKYKALENVIKCDIDEEAINIYKEKLVEWHKGSFFDSRVTLKHTDVIITDLTEPTEGSPSKRLYSKEFFSLCKNKLKANGTLAIQASLFRITTYEMHASIAKTIKEIFPITRSFAPYVPSFDTTWGFIFASNQADPINFSPEEIDKRISEKIEGDLRYYDGITHLHLFSLGKDLRELLDKEGQIITDDAPFHLERKDQI